MYKAIRAMRSHERRQTGNGQPNGAGRRQPPVRIRGGAGVVRDPLIGGQRT